MLKVYSITAFALVQAFVLFIGLTNANTVSYCSTVCQQVISVSSSTSPSVSSSASPSVSSSASPSVSSSASPNVSSSTSPSVSSNASVGVSALRVSASTSVGVSSSTSASVSAPSKSASTTTSVSASTSTSVSACTSASVSSSTSASVSTTCSIVCSSSVVSSSVVSSSVVFQTPGSVVIICLLVEVSNCDASLHGSTSSSQSQALLANMKNTYSALQVVVISVDLTSSACASNNYVALCSKVTFKLGIPSNLFIETILKDEIKDKYLGNLPVSDTQYNITFKGVTLDYNIKDGECQRVCCKAGGHVAMVEKCTPKEYKCEGFLAKEKKETEHCHGERNDLCSSTTCTDKGCSSHSPSLALLILLTVGSFVKITAY